MKTNITPHTRNLHEVSDLLALGIRRLPGRKTVENLNSSVDFTSKWSVRAPHLPLQKWEQLMNTLRTTNTVLQQVTALPKMDRKDLTKLWKNLFGTDPLSQKRTYLIERLAYRIQEIAYEIEIGSIEARLDTYSTGKRGISKTAHQPPVGTTLVREYQGVEHHVTVLTEGFAYKGARYLSLSQIARHITNTRWNGLVFFGLKRSGRK